MERTSEARILYTPRSDAQAQMELDAVSRVLKFILFERNASKKAAEAGGRDDVKVSSEHVAIPNHNRCPGPHV